MRKFRREVTRKNPEDFRTADYADVTDSGTVGAASWISVGVRRGGRPTIVIGFATARSRPAGSF